MGQFGNANISPRPATVPLPTSQVPYWEIVKTVELENIDLTSYIGGGCVMWGQAAAERWP